MSCHEVAHLLRTCVVAAGNVRTSATQDFVFFSLVFFLPAPSFLRPLSLFPLFKNTAFNLATPSPPCTSPHPSTPCHHSFSIPRFYTLWSHPNTCHIKTQANEINWSMNGAASVDASSREGSDMTMCIAVMTGLTYMCLISTFQRVSGGHFNPAITLAAMVSRRIGILPAVLYIIVQIVAGIAGTAIFDGMSGNDNYGELGKNQISNEFDTGSIFGVELMATMWVTLIWFFSLDLGAAPCGRHRDELGPMYVGFAYTLAVALTTRWDRGGINPARSFGPAVLAESWDQHWVFWMGPMIGAMAGALIFELFLWLSPGARNEQKQAF